MNILLTGATGYVGRALAERLIGEGHHVTATVRNSSRRSDLPPGCHVALISDLGSEQDWRAKLKSVDVVCHLAARVHIMHETAEDPLAAFRRTNVDGTRFLAEAAADAGVRRFVFVSTIKVNGEETTGRPFRAEDPPAPVDAYARSKLEAERIVAEVCRSCDMEYVIVRPPLVYGPGVGGNLERLIRLIHRGVPLPLASVENRRSLVSLANLVDLLSRLVIHPRAGGHVYLVSDGSDWSIVHLVRAIADSLGRPAHLFRFPPGLLRLVARVTGKEDELRRISGSLEVDIAATRMQLDWSPPQHPEVALRAMVTAFKQEDRIG